MYLQKYRNAQYFNGSIAYCSVVFAWLLFTLLFFGIYSSWNLGSLPLPADMFYSSHSNTVGGTSQSW